MLSSSLSQFLLDISQVQEGMMCSWSHMKLWGFKLSSTVTSGGLWKLMVAIQDQNSAIWEFFLNAWGDSGAPLPQSTVPDVTWDTPATSPANCHLHSRQADRSPLHPRPEPHRLSDLQVCDVLAVRRGLWPWTESNRYVWTAGIWSTSMGWILKRPWSVS